VPRQNSIHLYFQQLRSSFSYPQFSRSKADSLIDEPFVKEPAENAGEC